MFSTVVTSSILSDSTFRLLTRAPARRSWAAAVAGKRAAARAATRRSRRCMGGLSLTWQRERAGFQSFTRRRSRRRFLAFVEPEGDPSRAPLPFGLAVGVFLT